MVQKRFSWSASTDTKLKKGWAICFGCKGKRQRHRDDSALIVGNDGMLARDHALTRVVKGLFPAPPRLAPST